MSRDATGVGRATPAAIETTRLTADDAALECFLVPWDSAIFGFPVAQIDHLDIGRGDAAAALLRAFASWCAERDVRFASCRLDHAQLRESMALEDGGFRFVEMVHRPRLTSLANLATPGVQIDVAPAEAADREGIEAIAYDAFGTGRFLLDRRLPPDLSRRRYASWVRTSLETPEHLVLKAERDGDLLGFFIVEPRPDGSVYWHLTAVDPRWQGRGIGLALWQTMLLRHRSEGAASVGTTISGHNLPALNLYARLGFSFASAGMTFHWLRERG